MRWPARFRGDEGGFTLVELIIGMAIVTLLIGAIGSALVVSLRTTGVTNGRFAESHDVQITSAYLANDVQSAAGVNLGSGGNCSGASTTLITFQYATGQAVYTCGVTDGETQVVRTFGSRSVVLAHFAGSSRPTVSCSPNADCSVVSSVTMRFTEVSGYTYTLVGSRRGYSSGAVVGGAPPADITLLSTGTSSPLWVQGSCQDGGTDPLAACAIDPSTIALPISDVTTTGWTPTPVTPTTLWDKLSDQSDATYVTTIQNNVEVKVALAPVDPPDPLGPTPNPTVEIRASAVLNGSAKLNVSLYDGATLLATNQVNVNSTKNYDWTLSNADTSKISAAAYGHLTIGLAMKTSSGVNVSGVALDTANPSGLLTINGSLYVNSQNANAVRLTGSKSAKKVTITGTPPGGDFRILSPGACSGCNHTTVDCSGCTWTGQQPWTSYQTPLPDPLRSLAAPPEPTVAGACAGSVCQPGRYDATLSRTANTTLSPGTYYLKQGISITGSASLTCPAPCTGGVLLYIAGGSVTLAGGSTIDLTAPTSGIYTGILIFQARSDANPVKIAGNAGSSTAIKFNGIIYVPNSTQVTLATGAATLTAKAIVAQNIKVSSSVTIG